MTLSADPASEATLQAEVERLRGLAPDTKTLYREVASVLFFRFGIAPTANRLYQLVGKGSMSTAATVLAKFWQDLREHGRLRLEHPAVPQELRDIGGELIGQLWKVAYDQAQADLAQVRLEVQNESIRLRANADHALHEAAEAETKAAELVQEVEVLRARLVARDGDIAELDRELVQVRADLASVTASLADARTHAEQGRRALSGDLEALRAAIALTEERARGSERRALTEIETSRRKVTEAERTLLAERKRFQAQAARLEKLLEKREAEIGALRERVVRSETTLVQTSAQLKAEQGKLSKLLSKIQLDAVSSVKPPLREQRKPRSRVRA